MENQKNIIAMRVATYEPFEAKAYAHIASLGLRHAEITVPAPDAIEATKAELEKYGLVASSMHGECDVSREDTAEQVAAQMPAFAALGCKIMFVSVARGELAADVAYARLHAAGEVAKQHGVTIAMETHPDLITNADVAIETLTGVNHPNVRMNFDTANLYFYNHDMDSVAELRKVIDRVASVHLKDTDGGYKLWHFPALGEGIVDFPGIFSVLDETGFAGPCTLEVEGFEGEEKTEELILGRMAASVEYLRKLGRI